MNDKERKIYKALTENNVVETLFGLNEEGKNPILYGDMSFDKEQLKEFAAVAARVMAEDMDDECVDEYCTFVSSDNYKKMWTAQSKGIAEALIYEVTGKISSITTGPASAEPEIVFESDDSRNSETKISMDDDGLINFGDMDFDPDKVN